MEKNESGEWYWADVDFHSVAKEDSPNPCPILLTRVWVPDNKAVEDMVDEDIIDCLTNPDKTYE